MRRTYRVSAKHVVAKYGCRDALATCSQDRLDGTWHAVMAGYGCSKNYRTPEDAIRGMLQDHACTSIRIALVKLDPECPHVVQFRDAYRNDPHAREAEADFTEHHREHCARCVAFAPEPPPPPPYCLALHEHLLSLGYEHSFCRAEFDDGDAENGPGTWGAPACHMYTGPDEYVHFDALGHAHRVDRDLALEAFIEQQQRD